MLEIFESLVRVLLLAVVLGGVWVCWSLLAGNGSPLRPVLSCLNCSRELGAVDVVHCAKCLGV